MREGENSGVVSEWLLVLSEVLVVGVKEDAVGSRESDMLTMEVAASESKERCGLSYRLEARARISCLLLEDE